MSSGVPGRAGTRLSSWEERLSKPLRLLHLESIRNKILGFALLATLIPSLSTTWLSYSEDKRSLQEKITGELQSVSAETAREMDLWLKERLYDLRVFASSYEVSENLDRASSGETQGVRRLSDYLTSVRERFTDYEELVVVNREGQVVATSTGSGEAVTLPEHWVADVRGGNAAVGDPYWDETLGRVVDIVAVPIRVANGRFVGALAAKLNLRSVDDILKRFAPVPAGVVYLITPAGAVITSSRFGSGEPMRTKLADATTRTLLSQEFKILDYSGLEGAAVVGSLRRIARLDWGVVAEIPNREAFRAVTRLRNVTILIMLTLLAGIGLVAYLLGLLIVRPLDRLTRGAAQVAAGDLAVDLPVSGGEVGYLTEVFNNMVARLREGRQALDAINETLRTKNEELERLSVTDGLTKLSNRRFLMEWLAKEVLRCRRHKRAFAVLLADVDNFKHHNDTFGHLAGDEVLARVGVILRESTREVDCSARYGGEEFVVVLAETAMDGAVEVSERIRARLAKERFAGNEVTLSIGVAEFPAHGQTPEGVVASADAAMYAAKQEGGDRVTRAMGGGSARGAGRRRPKEAKKRA